MKTTKAHFEIFKQEFRRWVEILGLKDWELFFEHDDKKNRASVSYNIVSKIATVYLGNNWTHIKAITDYDLSRVAFHEACELMLGRLMEVGRSRYVSEVEFEEAGHDIIRRLENSFFEIERGKH